MPYGYYMLVRFVSTILFGFYAYQEFEKNNQTYGFAYIILALLFQPFYKIALGRELWNLVDVIIGGWLGYQFWLDRNKFSN